MERAAAKFLRQQAEREAVFDVLLYVPAHGAHHRGLWIGVNRLGTAAQAGAIAFSLGCGSVLKEADVLAAWAPGGTRRAAENAGARDRENECAVEGTVAREHALPAAGFS